MKKNVIIVAGGKGLRMSAEVPKQFILLKNKPLLMHTIETFYNFDTQIKIILVLPKEHIKFWQELCQKHHFKINCTVVKGGTERFFSVKNGLELIEDNSVVAIHDGVRPFVSRETLKNCFETAEKLGNAVPVLMLNESVRWVEDGKNSHINRANLRIVQTPQIFRSEILKTAFLQDFNENFTDDASVAEAFGEQINLVDGNIENIKITANFDLKIAKSFFQRG
jgi:2-C-methyl-D-erythritol 4-phosphate cytidylyltransferase